MNLKCWWLGCAPHPQDPAPPLHVTCQRCGEVVGYGDLVGDTRYQRFKDGLVAAWYLITAWYPRKCYACGQRFQCDQTVDHIPF